jgi:hypothetical protein
VGKQTSAVFYRSEYRSHFIATLLGQVPVGAGGCI